MKLSTVGISKQYINIEIIFDINRLIEEYMDKP